MHTIETKIGFIPAAEDLRGMEGRAVAINGTLPLQFPNGLWQLPHRLVPRGVISVGSKVGCNPSVTVIGVCPIVLDPSVVEVLPGEQLTPNREGYFIQGGTFATALQRGTGGRKISALVLPSGMSQPSLLAVTVSESDIYKELVTDSFVVCKNLSHLDVILNMEPSEGEVCVITRKGLGTVTIIGQVNGTSNLKLLSVHDTVQLKYSNATGGWVIT